jgi:hypothetical protein
LEEELLSSKAKRGTFMGLMQTAPCSTLETEDKGRSCAVMIGTLGKEGRKEIGDKEKWAVDTCKENPILY